MGNGTLPSSTDLTEEINNVLKHVIPVLNTVKHLNTLGMGRGRFATSQPRMEGLRDVTSVIIQHCWGEG